MTWCGVHGHDQIVESFRSAIAQGRMASTFLFVGPSGVGKKLFAMRLAQAFQCAERSELEFEPCLQCESCQQIESLTHPDLELVSKPEDRNFIPVSTFIGDKEHRMREGLCPWIGLKPAYGRRKIAIIDDADHLNQEGANCLLKTLEEPPPRSILILIGTSQQRQLPTIRSRCQIVRFDRLSDEFVADRLLTLEVVSNSERAKALASESNGSIDRALDLNDEALGAFRDELFDVLPQTNIDSIWMSKFVSDFVEAAGKDTPARRKRLKSVVEMFLTFYRHMMNAQSGVFPVIDERLASLVQSALQNGPSNFETIAQKIDRCVLADQQITLNANIPTLIECWIDDLIHGDD